MPPVKPVSSVRVDHRVFKAKQVRLGRLDPRELLELPDQSGRADSPGRLDQPASQVSWEMRVLPEQLVSLEVMGQPVRTILAGLKHTCRSNSFSCLFDISLN